MKSEIVIPYVYILKNNSLIMIPTFICSTMLACMLLTFFPALTPLWSALAVNAKTSDWN